MKIPKKIICAFVAAVTLFGVFFNTYSYGVLRSVFAETEPSGAPESTDIEVSGEIESDTSGQAEDVSEEETESEAAGETEADITGQTEDVSEEGTESEKTGYETTEASEKETCDEGETEETSVAPEEESTTQRPVPQIAGDADCDSKITAADARLVLRAAVGLESLQFEDNCDMDGDGKITSYDARIVIRLAVGLPAEETEEDKKARDELVSRYLERKAEEERASREEESRRAKEESKRAAEEESRKAEEASRKAEEEKRKAEEESRKAEEEKRKAEEESRKAEEERKKAAEKERKEKEERKNNWLKYFPDAVSYNELSDNMRWLVNDIGIRSWWNHTQNTAADLIYERLGTYGFSGSNRKKIQFNKNGITGRNIMAIIPTKKSKPDILLIMAHYDTARETGGAVDNASGTALLMQLAKRFNLKGEDYGVEIRFLFTAGEEQGYYGAYAYVNSLSSSEKARHKIVYNIDMAGKPNNKYEPGRTYYLAVSTEPVSTDGYSAPPARANIGSKATDEAKSALGKLGENGYYSPVRAGVHDIVPFRKAGMASLTLSWRCIASSRSSGADYNLASPYLIHSKDDNIANFDMQSLYNTTRLVAAAMARLILPYTEY